MTERTLRHLISPLGPNWVGTDSACGLAICTFHLGFSLGRANTQTVPPNRMAMTEYILVSVNML